MVLDDKLGINYGAVDNDEKTAETEKYVLVSGDPE